jgi:predicted nucleic acid-binding protein
MSFPATTIKSDSLATLRPLFETNSVLKMLGQIFKIAVIIDANFIIRDILWLARKRKKPDSRTELFEVLLAGTVTAYAPTFLEEEMSVNLPYLARQHNLLLAELEAHWQTYRTFIKFVDTGEADDTYEDPKDAPYLKLQAELGVFILSKDSDIARMGGQVADATLVTRLRTYSRHVAIEYTLKAGGAGTLAVSFGTLALVRRFIVWVIVRAKKLPRWVWFIAIILIIAALLHPPTRQRVSTMIKSLSGKARETGSKLLTHLEKIMVEHEQAKRAAVASLAGVQTELDGVTTHNQRQRF